MVDGIDSARLIDAALSAARKAYAPYSRFAVGAAVLLADDAIVTGANVENASYGLSLCAETVAIATAAAQGRLADVVAIAVTGGPMGVAGPEGSAVVSPCGRCRQIINEAAQLGGRDLPVLCFAPDRSAMKRHHISDLLPDAFGPGDLGTGD